MKTLLAILLLCLRLHAAAELPDGRPVHVLTIEQSLHDCCAMPGARTIQLGKMIALTKSLTIPASVEFIPGQYGLVQGGGATVMLDGELVAGRQSIFFGFMPGEIRGTFGGQPKLPEWWQHDASRADIAINCAVQSSPRLYGSTGHDVSLGAVTYRVARDIFMGGMFTVLRGAGAGRTELLTTSEWTGDWQNASEWPERAGGNHAAVVWIGGKAPGNSSFHSGVVGVTITAHAASLANPDKYVSGISSKAWVEECSVIHDVAVHWASGCSIGFPKHNGGIGTVNGLHMERLWLTGAVRRDSVPLLFTEHANNVSLDTFTIDMRLPKQSSADYATPGQSDPAIYPKPPHILDWPKVGIKAMGKLKISQGHIEGCQTGIWIAQGYSPNTIKISGVDVWNLYDANQVWHGDGRRRAGAAPEGAGQWDYATAVLLSSTDWDLTRNYKDRCVLENIISHGNVKFILKDLANNVSVSAYGQGQFPEHDTGGLTSFARGDAFKPGNYTLTR